MIDFHASQLHAGDCPARLCFQILISNQDSNLRALIPAFLRIYITTNLGYLSRVYTAPLLQQTITRLTFAQYMDTMLTLSELATFQALALCAVVVASGSEGKQFASCFKGHRHGYFLQPAKPQSPLKYLVYKNLLHGHGFEL